MELVGLLITLKHLNGTKMSAEQGYAYAQLALGNAYLYGNGVQQNDLMAYTWFELASINGRDEANAYIKALSKRMSQKKYFRC